MDLTNLRFEKVLKREDGRGLPVQEPQQMIRWEAIMGDKLLYGFMSLRECEMLAKRLAQMSRTVTVTPDVEAAGDGTAMR